MKVFYLDREATLRAVCRAVEALAARRQEVERVLLFGSLATGRAAPGSDADLLVVLRESDRSFVDRIPLYRPEGCPVGVDVFPYTKDEMKSMLAAGNGLIRRALGEGIEIFPAGKLE